MPKQTSVQIATNVYLKLCNMGMSHAEAYKYYLEAWKLAHMSQLGKTE
jgi:hypothetical protein